jgi:hypothetical protein
MHTQALLDTIDLLNKRARQLKDICELVIAASLYWSSIDEEKKPYLKALRTTASLYLEEIK